MKQKSNKWDSRGDATHELIVKTSEIPRVCDQIILLVDSRTWNFLISDAGILISCHIYRKSPKNGSWGVSRQANAYIWK